ncbi:hypothetical protein PHLGIDRAFT_127424 [Phlebiopsis gigantea 11061_1 CR5-6]|uniref:Uncharacterized protein n=1 Tax=Phlebiopsis gigantea (strain 11061_1 CR5-6) TaxID=745531 RepID=A0A0C3SB90_PHLG1|nr:hypothetical protein PHLGIDRAFT_127424 [Phlebiopsis gigantea 11061_1 CR5-6]
MSSSQSSTYQLPEHEGFDPPRPATQYAGSDATPPSLPRSLPSQRSSRSTSTRSHQRPRPDGESDRHKDDRSREGSARILSRVASRSDRDIKHVRTLLVLTNDRLEAETRRADQAEQRVVDVLQRLRAANEATALARAEASRAQQEVRLYHMQLEQAQREINRAQEIVDQVEKARVEAEEEAARSRSVARKCREQWVLSKAREQGRQQGFAEGLERARRMGLSQVPASPMRQVAARPYTPLRPATPSRKYGRDDEDDEDEDEDKEEAEEEEEEEEEDDDDDSYKRRPATGFVPDVIIEASPPSPPPQPVPFRSRQRTSVPGPQPTHVPDVARIADMLPIQTVTTPINAPSPSHDRPPPPDSPSLPIPEPARSEDPLPIPFHEAPPSPSHPAYHMPPDNWVPLSRDGEAIPVPPPHEFSRPVSPVDPSPAHSQLPLPPLPHEDMPSSIDINEDPKPVRYEPSVRSRDYAYGAGSSRGPPPSLSIRSPQSRTSTRISEYDLVGPPKFERTYRQGVDRDSILAKQAAYREGRETMSPRGPRDLAVSEGPVPLRTGSGPSDHADRRPQKSHHSSDYRGPLERLFRKHLRSRQSSDVNTNEHSVPAITVESPSTDGSHPSSAVSTSAPHLLSPEHAHSALPALMDILGPAEPPAVPATAVYTMHAPTPPPLPMLQRASSPYYAEAPVPGGVVYPESPARAKSRASTARSDSPGTKSRRRQASLAGSVEGRLSPLSLGAPFSSFAVPDGR